MEELLLRLTFSVQSIVLRCAVFISSRLLTYLVRVPVLRKIAMQLAIRK